MIDFLWLWFKSGNKSPLTLTEDDISFESSFIPADIGLQGLHLSSDISLVGVFTLTDISLSGTST